MRENQLFNQQESLPQRLAIKEQLLSTFKQLQPVRGRTMGSPLTNLDLSETSMKEIEEMTADLEALNPHPSPLVDALPLLNGAWQLEYSTAREIRSLARLPLGLKVGKVYQVIDIASQSFSNQAFITHSLGLLSGYVKVTATFSPWRDGSSSLPDKRLNIQFQKRYLAIDKIVNLKTPQLSPFKIVAARNPQGRIPTLDITYLDETLRIGRGGDGSLFILSKVVVESLNKLLELTHQQ